MLVKRRHHHLHRHCAVKGVSSAFDIKSAYDLYYMKEIIIDYLWRIGAHACWQLNELIKARPSWTINLTHLNRFREISIYYMLAILVIDQCCFRYQSITC